MVDEIEPHSSPGGDHGLRGCWARIPPGARLVIPIALLLAVVVVSFYNWVRPARDDWSRLPSRLVCQVQSGPAPPPSLTVASVDVAHPRGNVLALTVHFVEPLAPGDQLVYSLANNGLPFAALTHQQGGNDLAIRNVRQPGGADIRSGKGTSAALTQPDAVEMVLDLTKFGIEQELVSPALTVSSSGYAMQICHG
ncbi:hypothetical protein [Mycobacterium shigaense]|uniref:Membrane protein n=1 Tax=Mycobacterium shigaense TaxID=722731 RepID=A0A1Z4ENK2_9MYCO|nr:hypothetical protein [Mycobacterium shigaense]MEA1122802.1 hypothetical protein [Mycobacterium shigaense]BAX94584.1 membrane protein [Mycobacterium shigaense]